MGLAEKIKSDEYPSVAGVGSGSLPIYITQALMTAKIYLRSALFSNLIGHEKGEMGFPTSSVLGSSGGIVDWIASL
ncbi:MAG TPA: hypothetical protein EYP68_02080 [Candidatus Korarchaeota archaeon]|nr:hypothetical protein [Candidatus Korarchaeota archaeon]